MYNRVLYVPKNPPDIDEHEVLRYLGYGKNRPDSTTEQLIKRCTEKLRAEISPRCVYAAIKIKHSGRLALEGCSLILEGQDIADHLINCQIAVLMAVTLSEQADRLIRHATAKNLTKGIVMDACASAAVESVCNQTESMIRSKFSGSFFTERFSPGYGDLPIELQKDFLAVLDAQRTIGLCATQSSILTPRKSVTAVIGVGNMSAAPSKTGCNNCRLRENCSFFKRGEFCGFSKPS